MSKTSKISKISKLVSNIGEINKISTNMWLTRIVECCSVVDPLVWPAVWNTFSNDLDAVTDLVLDSSTAADCTLIAEFSLPGMNVKAKISSSSSSSFIFFKLFSSTLS